MFLFDEVTAESASSLARVQYYNSEGRSIPDKTKCIRTEIPGDVAYPTMTIFTEFFFCKLFRNFTFHISFFVEGGYQQIVCNLTNIRHYCTSFSKYINLVLTTTLLLTQNIIRIHFWFLEIRLHCYNFNISDFPITRIYLIISFSTIVSVQVINT